MRVCLAMLDTAVRHEANDKAVPPRAGRLPAGVWPPAAAEGAGAVGGGRHAPLCRACHSGEPPVLGTCPGTCMDGVLEPDDVALRCKATITLQGNCHHARQSSVEFTILQLCSWTWCPNATAQCVPSAMFQQENVVSALPHDSHFMGILLAEMAALSTCHPEQNPALAGQNIYADKEIVDKQILRLIGAHIPDCLHFYNLQICMNRYSGWLSFHDRQPCCDSCTAHGSGTACQAIINAPQNILCTSKGLIEPAAAVQQLSYPAGQGPAMAALSHRPMECDKSIGDVTSLCRLITAPFLSPQARHQRRQRWRTTGRQMYPGYSMCD